MRNIPPKVDDVSVLPADDFNSINDEMRTIISSGSEVIGGPDNQLSKGISNYTATADFYIESGSPDAITLAVTNNRLQVTELFNGLRVRFIATNTNTGDPSGVTVKVGSLALTPLKQPNGSPLPGGAIVQGEMAELLFDEGAGFFIIASSSNTRMITSDTVIGVAPSGGSFSTFHDAYESIRNKYILDSVTVTFEIGGKVIETLPTVISHSEGNNIKVIGEPAITTDIIGILNVSGVAGFYSVEYEILNGTLPGLVNGDYVIIHDAVSSGPNVLKEYGRKHEGIWKIEDAGFGSGFTAVNKFGFGGPDALKTSDLSSAKVTLLKSSLNYGVAGTGLEIKNTLLNTLSDLLIINTLGAGGTAFVMRNAHMSIDNKFFGVVSETQGAINMVNSSISEAGIIAAIAGGGRDSVDMEGCKVFQIDSLIANGTNGRQSLNFSQCIIQGKNLVACGNANATPITSDGPNAIECQLGCSILMDKIFTIANVAVGLGIFNGSSVRCLDFVSVDNDIGVAVFEGSNFTILFSTDVVDNKRGRDVGIEIGKGSMVSASTEGGRLVITGNTNNDVLASGTCHFEGVAITPTATAMGKVSAALVSSMIIIGVVPTSNFPIQNSIIDIIP